MLPLKIETDIEKSLQAMKNSMPAFCCISKCNELVSGIYKTIEKRLLPMCTTHFGMIASEVLW
jgi:hypothetical protein